MFSNFELSAPNSFLVIFLKYNASGVSSKELASTLKPSCRWWQFKRKGLKHIYQLWTKFYFFLKRTCEHTEFELPTWANDALHGELGYQICNISLFNINLGLTYCWLTPSYLWHLLTYRAHSWSPHCHGLIAIEQYCIVTFLDVDYLKHSKCSLDIMNQMFTDQVFSEENVIIEATSYLLKSCVILNWYAKCKDVAFGSWNDWR